jgi:hypothetical protein
MDETASGSCPLSGFGINSVGFSGFVITELGEGWK